MNILLTADQYYPPTLGGSAISVRRLAHGLAARGHRVTVLAPSPNFSDFTEREDDIVVVRCRSLPALHLLKHADRDSIRVAFLPMLTVRKAVAQLEPDVIHIQFPPYIGLTALRVAQKLGIPSLGTLHALPDNPFPGRNKRSAVFRLFASGYWQAMVDWSAQCDVVTAPSRTACQILASHGLQGAIPVSNGVDLAVFHPAADDGERRAVRAHFGVPPDRPLVLYAGRFSPEKRLDVFLRALPMVLARLDAHFLMVGTGSKDVAETAERLGLASHVTFTGLLPDEQLPLAYRAADVFALPSEAELQGMVLLEAAASGLPLVGADSHAIPEVVLHGQNGYLHRPGDHRDLAQRLVSILSDHALSRRFSQRSLQVARQHSFERTLRRYETLYEELSARKMVARAAPARRGA